MYFVSYAHQEGSNWLAEFPDAPGCQTFAETREELLAMAIEALEGWLEAHLVAGKAPPRPREKHERPADRFEFNVPVRPSLSAVLSIRWARQDLNLSQAALAKRIGVSQQQIAKLENPDENPTLRSLEEVASKLGMRLDISFQHAPVG